MHHYVTAKCCEQLEFFKQTIIKISYSNLTSQCRNNFLDHHTCLHVTTLCTHARSLTTYFYLQKIILQYSKQSAWGFIASTVSAKNQKITAYGSRPWCFITIKVTYTSIIKDLARFKFLQVESQRILTHAATASADRFCKILFLDAFSRSKLDSLLAIGSFVRNLHDAYDATHLARARLSQGFITFAQPCNLTSGLLVYIMFMYSRHDLEIDHILVVAVDENDQRSELSGKGSRRRGNRPVLIFARVRVGEIEP